MIKTAEHWLNSSLLFKNHQRDLSVILSHPRIRTTGLADIWKKKNLQVYTFGYILEI